MRKIGVHIENLITDFVILANLSTDCDIIEILSETLHKPNWRLLGSFLHSKAGVLIKKSKFLLTKTNETS